jgi:hypothetical protein
MVNFNSNFTSGGDNLPPELRAKIEGALNAPAAKGSLAALNAQLQKDISAYNRTPQAELGGFSPEMLLALSRYPWDTPECPLKLNAEVSAEKLAGVKRLRETRDFLQEVQKRGRVKATPKGNLPRSFVKEMLDTFLNPSEQEELFAYNKVLNEEDVFPLHETRLICKLCGLLTLRKGHYTVSKRAAKLMEPGKEGALYKWLFLTYFRKYNIGYRYNRGIDLDWLQRETGYILMPLQQYANKWIDPSVHTEKWLHPMSLQQLEDELADISYMDAIYAIERYFIEPFEKWGLLEVKRKKKGYCEKIHRIRKTALFDDFIDFQI